MVRRRRSARALKAPADETSLSSPRQLTNPTQPIYSLYNNLPSRRLNIPARRRHRRTPSITPPPPPRLAAYKASCMRKCRRPSALNVGQLQITQNAVLFDAHFLSVSHDDAHLRLPISDISVVRRACYRRLLPFGVLIKCSGFPDYLMVLADREQQENVLRILADALRSRELKAVDESDTFLSDDASNTSMDDFMSGEPRESSETVDIASASEPDCELPPQVNVPSTNARLETSRLRKSVTFDTLPPSALRSREEAAPSLPPLSLKQTSPPQRKPVENHVQRERILESMVLLLSALLLLFASFGVVLAIGALRHRLWYLTKLLSTTQTNLI